MQKLVVCITGGIASGKTQVSNYMAAKDCQVIDADIIAREVVAADTPGWQQLVNYFGTDILSDSGEINRSQLRSKVFQDESLRQQLNAITHPLIQENMLNQIQSAESGLVVLVIPLLDKSKAHAYIDRVLVVDVLADIQLSRIQRRDKISESMAKRIIATQASRQQRLTNAGDVISNNHDLKLLEHRTGLLLKFYLSLLN